METEASRQNAKGGRPSFRLGSWMSPKIFNFFFLKNQRGGTGGSKAIGIGRTEGGLGQSLIGTLVEKQNLCKQKEVRWKSYGGM